MAHESKSPYTTQDLINALEYTYNKVVQEHISRGSAWRGMTRKEYEENRRDTDPSYRSIEQLLGGWSNFTQYIPEQSQVRKKIDPSLPTVDNFRVAVTAVAKYYGKSVHKVTISDFRTYYSHNPDDRVLDWRTYAKHLGYASWKQMIRAIFDGKDTHAKSIS